MKRSRLTCHPRPQDRILDAVYGVPKGEYISGSASSEIRPYDIQTRGFAGIDIDNGAREGTSALFPEICPDAV